LVVDGDKRLQGLTTISADGEPELAAILSWQGPTDL
jgi:hypothetical protein